MLTVELSLKYISDSAKAYTEIFTPVADELTAKGFTNNAGKAVDYHSVYGQIKPLYQQYNSGDSRQYHKVCSKVVPDNT